MRFYSPPSTAPTAAQARVIELGWGLPAGSVSYPRVATRPTPRQAVQVRQSAPAPRAQFVDLRGANRFLAGNPAPTPRAQFVNIGGANRFIAGNDRRPFFLGDADLSALVGGKPAPTQADLDAAKALKAKAQAVAMALAPAAARLTTKRATVASLRKTLAKAGGR